ncbi:hypothetical protein M8998_07190 [Sphingobacterium sp. lm-10]|uniref:DUF6965 family protein n=1 Tax=Sphingobacterium sp. lm-10 TaxID=2944904 RepID=UPI0020225ED5|nr:hypothetical protein [Sphingobacterium sp. lm-10]MCL7987718.1 hypothetical protein [Sphingobacterium sp. lm-10]
MEHKPDQLYDELMNKEYPANIRINSATVVIDAQAFLIVQFDMVKRHKGDLKRCAAWQRLKEFREAVKKL